MQEIKDILAMVKDLPNFTLTVLTGFLIYKLAIVGSIYSVVRFIATKYFAAGHARIELEKLELERELKKTDNQ